MTLSTASAVVLVFTSGVYFFSSPAADNDLWGHLFFGREILTTGSLSSVNSYSYTSPDYPWINHEIGAECVFSWVFDRLSAPGLLALKILLGLVTLAIMARSARRRTSDPLAWATALVLAASLMSFGYLIRPQIFTFLGLAWLWDLLQGYASQERRGIWFLPVIFVLWINTHGGVLAGEAVLVAFTVLYQLTEGQGSDVKRLGCLAAASLLALLCNPYGWRLPVFLFHDLLVDRQITEWAHISLLDRSNLHFKATVAISAGGCLLSRKRHPWEILLIAGAAAAVFRHERHLPVFAILVTPYLAETVDLAIRRFREKSGIAELSRGAHAALAASLAVLATFQLVSVVRMYQALEFQIFVSPAEFPVDALRFIRENRLHGNIAVPFGWGEYAIWHLAPDCPVSIDGRYTTAYPNEVIDQAWRYMEGSPGWDGILKGAVLALADRRNATARLLMGDRRWQPIYTDDTALLFVRRDTPIPDPLLRRQRLEPERAFFFP